EGKIKTARELLNPKSETAELKVITARLYATVNGLSSTANSLSTYIKMAGKDVPFSSSDFGISLLRNKIRSKDVEGVLQGLRLVNANILKYRDALMTQGLTEDFIAQLNAAATSIAADNQAQYEIKENRKTLVQSNIMVFKDLYTSITELCEVGKNLYRGKNAQKLTEYTFSNLLKNVRVWHKAKEKKTDNDK
ncbi:MAG: hypothetical protein LBD59_09270, partial [Prevotellaceae bacterium]|nr:hypothetical protein [Prevotellaceae bacterium]